MADRIKGATLDEAWKAFAHLVSDPLVEGYRQDGLRWHSGADHFEGGGLSRTRKGVNEKIVFGVKGCVDDLLLFEGRTKFSG
jgi:hypothetical protein